MLGIVWHSAAMPLALFWVSSPFGGDLTSAKGRLPRSFRSLCMLATKALLLLACVAIAALDAEEADSVAREAGQLRAMQELLQQARAEVQSSLCDRRASTVHNTCFNYISSNACACA